MTLLLTDHQLCKNASHLQLMRRFFFAKVCSEIASLPLGPTLDAATPLATGSEGQAASETDTAPRKAFLFLAWAITASHLWLTAACSEQAVGAPSMQQVL